MTNTTYNKIALLGPGLIGASIGLALKKRGLAKQVVGLARRAATLETALRVGAIDTGTHHLEEALKDAEVVIFAAPVQASISLIEQTAALAEKCWDSEKDLPAGASKPLLTDACSTKSELVAKAQQCLPPWIDFIGGHPMAGSEATGPEHGNADLFEGATWILTPTQQTSETAASRAEVFARSLGAKPLMLSPQVHDELVAVVSHLPHMLAVALMQQAGETAVFHSQTWQVAAGGFRDMTRLAAGSAEIWRDICLTNASALAHALAEFRKRLEKIEEHINHHDADALVEILQQAHRQREGMKE